MNELTLLKNPAWTSMNWSRLVYAGNSWYLARCKQNWWFQFYKTLILHNISLYIAQNLKSCINGHGNSIHVFVLLIFSIFSDLRSVKVVKYIFSFSLFFSKHVMFLKIHLLKQHILEKKFPPKYKSHHHFFYLIIR